MSAIQRSGLAGGGSTVAKMPVYLSFADKQVTGKKSLIINVVPLL